MPVWSSHYHIRMKRFCCLIKVFFISSRLVSLVPRDLLLVNWTKKDGEPELRNQFIIRNARREIV